MLGASLGILPHGGQTLGTGSEAGPDVGIAGSAVTTEVWVPLLGVPRTRTRASTGSSNLECGLPCTPAPCMLPLSDRCPSPFSPPPSQKPLLVPFLHPVDPTSLEML